MSRLPTPPESYVEFSQHFPKLAEAWRLMADASEVGSLSERELRLVKLAVAFGAMREGAVHSNVRKGIAQGLARSDIEQVIAAAAGTIGMPATAAVFTWVRDILDPAASQPEHHR